MISRMFVSLVRDDGQADNTLIRVLGVVARCGFQIQGATLREQAYAAVAKLDVAYKGRTADEPAACREIMRQLSVHTLAN